MVVPERPAESGGAVCVPCGYVPVGLASQERRVDIRNVRIPADRAISAHLTPPYLRIDNPTLGRKAALLQVLSERCQRSANVNCSC